MSNIIEFIPEGEIPTTTKRLQGLAIINVIFILPCIFYLHDNSRSAFIGVSLVILVNIIFLFYTDDAIRITVYKDSGKLQYDYLTFFGKEKSTTVYLKTAYFKYKMDVSKTSSAMRLLIYNNYFKNKIAIRANERTGFSKSQLDDIAEAIENLRNKLNAANV
jgi:hypothetical protein